ncbi:MAG: hypothetical protein LBI33_05335 [Propionibacteriaceae bacterium]|jgi:hypothetical protein|nr:hypothetical protein [Propionibacteriaceae bacterium]
MIRESARRHGISDDDMRHALREWLILHDLTDPQERPFLLYVGPDRAGNLLEVGLNSAGDIVHAMPARTQYLPRAKETSRRR